MNTRRRILHMMLTATCLMFLPGMSTQVMADRNITFDNNGGVGEMASMFVPTSGSAELPACTFTKNGMQFAGWSWDQDGLYLVRYYDQEMVTDEYLTLWHGSDTDVTFYAQWIPAKNTDCAGCYPFPTIPYLIVMPESFPIDLGGEPTNVWIPLPETVPNDWRNKVWDEYYETCENLTQYRVLVHFRPEDFDYTTDNVSPDAEYYNDLPIIWNNSHTEGYADDGDTHYKLTAEKIIEMGNFPKLDACLDWPYTTTKTEDGETFSITFDDEWVEEHGYNTPVDETIHKKVNGVNYGLHYTATVFPVVNDEHVDDIIVTKESYPKESYPGYEYNGYYVYLTQLPEREDTYWHVNHGCCYTYNINPGLAWEVGVTYYPPSSIITEPTTICEGVLFGGKTYTAGDYTDVEWVEGETHKLYKTLHVSATVDASAILDETLNGTVTILENGPYCIGQSVLLDAQATGCYSTENIKWSDGHAPNSKQRNFVITGTPIHAILQKKQVPFISSVQNEGYVMLNNVQYADGATIPCGEEATVEAIANNGFIFVGWEDAKPGHGTGNINSTDNPRTFTPDESVDYIFTCPIFKKAVTVNVVFEDETGTVTVIDENGNSLMPGDQVPEGTTLTITATPVNDCYEFQMWSDGSMDNPLVISAEGESIDLTTSFDVKTYSITFKNGTETLATEVIECDEVPEYTGAEPTKEQDAQYTYSFSGWTPELTNAHSDATYQATFIPTPRQYDITFKNFNEEVLQTVQVNYGETPQYTGSTPIHEGNVYENYTWNGWAPAIVAASSNATYTATFTSVPIEYNINLAVKDNVGGTITVNNNGPYHYGDNVQINAVPNTGYTFVKWTETQSTDPHINLNVGGNVTYTAEFAKVHTVTIYVNGQAYGHVNVSGSTLSHEGNTYKCIDNADITITAVPEDDGCSRFERWADLGTNTPVSRMIKVTEDMNFTAVFAKKQYHITCNPSNGSVTIYDKDGNVISDNDANCGEKVTLVAQPAQGYHFVEWSDGVTTASRDINPISEDIILNVTFEQNVVDVDIKTDDEEGEVTIDLTEDNDGDGQIGIGDKITITAPTKDCKEFEKWSDENTENPRVIEVIGDISLTAQYKTLKYTIKTQVKPDGENVHGTTSAEIVNE